MQRLEKQKSQSGQVVVEYILLLVISVALILGLANQVYRPFGKWVENEMGPYLECLLDVGELPSLGGEISGECVNPFAAGNPSDPNSPNNRRRNAANSESSGGSSGSGGSRGGSGSGSSSSGRNRGFTVGGQGSADGAGSGNSEQMVEKLPESSFFKLRSGGSTVGPQAAGSGVKTLTQDNSGVLARKKTKEERVYSAGSLEIGENGNKVKPLIVSPPQRKPAAEDDDSDWNFGQYLKFALIIAIIIAIVLFIAGQVSSITKSMEK